MKKGSITVFLALILVLVLSFLFSLLEGARVFCLKSRAETVTEVCMQSMFGNYHAGLWEDYHLLFLDGTWQGEEFSMEKFVQRIMYEAGENLSGAKGYAGFGSWDLTCLAAENMTVSSYELATDWNGGAFQSQVSLQMKGEAVTDVLEELLEVQNQGQEAEGQKNQKEDRWEQAWDAIDQAEEWKEAREEEGQNTESGSSSGAAQAGESGETAPGGAEELTSKGEGQAELENPMDYVKEVKASSVLALVLKDPSKLSGKALKDDNFIEKRQLQAGNRAQEPQTGVVDRVLLQYYIQNYFSNYTAQSKKGPKEKALDYEMEYLLGRKKSDSENLETVVYELLGIREAMNFVTIMQDAEKKSLALSIATGAVGFTGMMPLVKAVQIGVLLAWAFVESVLDVRALLEGKKIPFLKRTDQWTSDLDCRSSIEGNSEAEEDGEGLSYTQYLQMLLFLLSGKTINYRCMDMMERNEQIRMDTMVQAVEGSFQYRAKPLFWNFNVLVRGGWNAFHIPAETSLSYAKF